MRLPDHRLFTILLAAIVGLVVVAVSTPATTRTVAHFSNLRISR